MARKTIAQTLGIISHPVRLDIIKYLYLRDGYTATVNSVMNAVTVAQPIASQHLIKLRQEGVLTMEAKGTCRHYKLNNPELVIGIIKVAETLVKELNRN